MGKDTALTLEGKEKREWNRMVAAAAAKTMQQALPTLIVYCGISQT